MTTGRDDLGFLLAKAGQRWNELLATRFAAAGYGDVRPAFGSVLIPLFEEDGLRMGELGRRARLSKQTMTQLVRRVERAGLVRREQDPADARAAVVSLTPRSEAFRPIVEEILGELEVAARAALGTERVEELRGMLATLVTLDP